jgi:putative GTP pyrophosphokinase
VLRRVAGEIRQDCSLLAEDDYIAQPRSSGYRALHLVVREGGVAIEVQLRTFRQDQWAELVETTARDIGLRLADGEGPDDLLELFRVASEIYATNDEGRLAPRSLMSEFERLLPAFRSILKSEPPETEG